MGERKSVGQSTIVGCQDPAAATLLQMVEAVTCGRPGELPVGEARIGLHSMTNGGIVGDFPSEKIATNAVGGTSHLNQ